MPEVISFIYDNLIHQAGFTEGQYSVRVRSLENDFPDYQGMTIYRITFPDLRRILIWSMQNSPEPEDKIKEDLVNYLESSGSLCGILLFRSGILQVCRHDDFTYRWNPNIQNLKEKLSGDILPYRLSFIRIIEEYLEGIYQTVSRIFFQTYGESEIENREFQILSVIINILILKMAEKHGIQISDDNEKSRLYTLKSFACEIPYHTDICVNVSGIPLSIIHTMVNAGLLVPLPDQVKISWIEPLFVTRVLGNIIEKKRLSGRQKKFRIIDEREEDFLLSSAIFGNVLNRIRRDYKSVPVIVDPACCEGEILISLMRYETGSDRVDCRLKQVATLLYGADPSISNIMLVKFGLVLRIIDSAFTDPSLLQVISPDYILQMREHIRVGSCILIRDTVIDCISEDDRRKVITALPPLSHHWPDSSPLMPAILMSFPKNQAFETEPDLKDYICRYFTSYSEGIDYSLLVVEHILNFTDYPAYIFLNVKWLSDARSARFRKWLKKSRMDHIILEYSENKNIGNYPLSVISGRENSDMITISIVKNDGIWQSHTQNPASLPDTDGWNLKDPRISLLSDKIRKNSISLYEYCLGEIYRSDEINLERDDGELDLIYKKRKIFECHYPYPTGS